MAKDDPQQAATTAMDLVISIIEGMRGLDPASSSFGSELRKLHVAVGDIGDARAAALVRQR